MLLQSLILVHSRSVTLANPQPHARYRHLTHVIRASGNGVIKTKPWDAWVAQSVEHPLGFRSGYDLVVRTNPTLGSLLEREPA